MILQAISNYLTEHNIKHKTTNSFIYHPDTQTNIYQAPDNTIIVSQPPYLSKYTTLDPADPNLLQKILKVLQPIRGTKRKQGRSDE
jgi:hypothetical protein